MNIVIALLILSGVIFFHELGHFLAAKKSGIRVNEFAIGMGPRIVSKKKGDTVYAWRLFPIGGMCVMQGEDENDHSEGSFQSAKPWQKIVVVAAGPVFNFILAFIISVITISIAGIDQCTVTSVTSGSNAEAAGLQEGDLILSYEGHSIANGRELYMYLQFDGLPEDSIDIKYERDGRTYTTSYTPDTVERYLLGFQYEDTEDGMTITKLVEGYPMADAGFEAGDVVVAINGYSIESSEQFVNYTTENPLSESEVEIKYIHDGETYTQNITPKKYTSAQGGFAFNLQREKVGVAETIGSSFGEVKYWINTTIKSLVGLVKDQFSVNDMSGPVGIVKTIGEVYDNAKTDGGLAVALSMFNMVILISANLGVMNLLPFPALDGGRILFLIIGCIRRKEINQNIEGAVHFAGIVLLMGLAIVIAISDVTKLF